MKGKETRTNSSNCDYEEKVLKSLLDAFGSAFSLEEIASAYLKAGYDADFTGEILYQMQESASRATSNVPIEVADNSGIISEKSCEANRNIKTSKHKIRPFSAGTVSSVIGREYARSKRSIKQFNETSKPLKVDMKMLPEFSGEGDRTNSTPEFHLHHSMEDFLFKMLGEGFGLEMEVIRGVLGSCGYDMQKSMEKLLNLSSSSEDERLCSVNKSSDEFTASHSSSDLTSCQRNKRDTHRPEGNKTMASSEKSLEFTNVQKARNDLQKDILTALFSASAEPEELPRRIVPRAKRSGRFGRLVCQPLGDMDSECEKHLEYKEQNNLEVAVEDEENNYQLLRKAVREYRATMKQYYAAAIDAFAKGDAVRAAKLIDQGHFFHGRAQDADEELSRLIFKPREVDSQDQILLNLCQYDAKEAVRILKSQISSFSGIPDGDIKHLKVITQPIDKSTSKQSVRRLVLKLLEKELIEWTEEENGGPILIRLDKIDRNQLNFIKNKR